MATRRIKTTEKTHLAQDDTRAAGFQSDISPAVPSSVLYKLLGFTIAMVTFPISSYFLTRHAIFGGNATYAGGLAALVANVVLIAYVVVAFKDDRSEREAAAAAEKKKES